MIKSFRDLLVYQEAYNLMLLVHEIVLRMPRFERNDLISQMRRCSKSIVANIAEGFAKRTFEREFKRHLNLAIGSSNEMESHLETARGLKYVEKTVIDTLLLRYKNLGGKLFSLYKNWKTY